MVLRGVFDEVRVMLVVLLLVVALIAFGGWDVLRRVAQSTAYQSHIREAQLLRSQLLRLQVDEETGVRGYLVTGDRRFLDIYDQARVAFPVQIADLRARLLQVDLQSPLAVLDEQDHLNALWLRDVAMPLVANPQTKNLDLMLAEKDLVDNFRARDRELNRSLDSAATDADRSLAHALFAQIVFLVSLLTILSLGGLAVAYFLSRSARRAFENRVLYQNQKRIADALQTAFLQKSLPMTPGIGLHAMYVPATSEAQVGGDWYDAFSLPDGRLMFSIGDVAGHGIDAAVVMSRARQAIVAAAVQENDPASVLARANDTIMLQESRMVTAICGFIDPESFRISYATAGHPPPVIARPGVAPEFLPHEGIPLGIIRSTTYRTFVATAHRDSLVAFYTDGVLEHKRDIFEGQRRLLAAVAIAVGREDPAVAIHETVFAGSSASDDVAIFTVTFRAVEGDTKAEATIDALQARRVIVGAKPAATPFGLLPSDRLGI